jgi:hypothetical protein
VVAALSTASDFGRQFFLLDNGKGSSVYKGRAAHDLGCPRKTTRTARKPGPATQPFEYTLQMILIREGVYDLHL